MKIFVLTFNDCVFYGNGTQNVTIFLNKEDAIKKMKEEYIEKCKEECVEEPMADDSYDNQITDNYAYISDTYYWDIFEREIDMAQ